MRFATSDTYLTLIRHCTFVAELNWALETALGRSLCDAHTGAAQLPFCSSQLTRRATRHARRPPLMQTDLQRKHAIAMHAIAVAMWLKCGLQWSSAPGKLLTGRSWLARLQSCWRLTWSCCKVSRWRQCCRVQVRQKFCLRAGVHDYLAPFRTMRCMRVKRGQGCFACRGRLCACMLVWATLQDCRLRCSHSTPARPSQRSVSLIARVARARLLVCRALRLATLATNRQRAPGAHVPHRGVSRLHTLQGRFLEGGQACRLARCAAICGALPRVVAAHECNGAAFGAMRSRLER